MTRTGSSAATSGSAVGLLACAPLSWASSEGVLSLDLSLLLFFFLLFLGRPGRPVLVQKFYNLIVSIKGTFLTLAGDLWGRIRWLGESSISIGKCQ